MLANPSIEMYMHSHAVAAPLIVNHDSLRRGSPRHDVRVGLLATYLNDRTNTAGQVGYSDATVTYIIAKSWGSVFSESSDNMFMARSYTSQSMSTEVHVRSRLLISLHYHWTLLSSFVLKTSLDLQVRDAN